MSAERAEAIEVGAGSGADALGASCRLRRGVVLAVLFSLVVTPCASAQGKSTPRVGILSVARRRDCQPLRQSWRNAGARGLGLSLHRVEVRASERLDEVFAAVSRHRIGAVVTGGGLFRFRARIAELASHRIPVLGDSWLWVETGSLLAYGASYADLARRAASYIDRILKGAKPGDLPIERPTRFELFVNLKAAKAMGVTVPQTILIRADKVID